MAPLLLMGMFRYYNNVINKNKFGDELFMRNIRIIKNWNYPNIMRQSPGDTGKWDDNYFTIDPINCCDAVVVFNHITQNSLINCKSGLIIGLMQEPPVEEYKWLFDGFHNFTNVYTPQLDPGWSNIINSHGALPWHVNKNYDFLKSYQFGPKPFKLSCVSSNDYKRPGQIARVDFLSYIKDKVKLDYWGKGFNEIQDKWDGLAPYQYSIAIENYSGPYYWTEKISDCFLSFTMPIYYGCTNIFDYFPKESIISIDILKPDEAVEIIQEAISSDLYLKNQEAIKYARNLVLEKYQIFPFISEIINKLDSNVSGNKPTVVFLDRLVAPYEKRNNLQKIVSVITRKLKAGKL
jgi:hypothetical protein